MLQLVNSYRMFYLAGFQSPFHRVKECYLLQTLSAASSLPDFQSPFHRVKECYVIHLGLGIFHDFYLSVPFSSGQGMLHFQRSVAAQTILDFQSPFHRVKECY